MSDFPIGKWRVKSKRLNTAMELEFDGVGRAQGVQSLGERQVPILGEWRVSADGTRLDIVGKVGGFVGFDWKLIRRAERVFAEVGDELNYLYVFEAMEKEWKLPGRNWHIALADAIRDCAEGDTIVVSTGAQKELAEAARTSMCPQKILRVIVVENQDGVLE